MDASFHNIVFGIQYKGRDCIKLWRELFYYLGLLMYLGILVVGCVLTGYWLGHWIDSLINRDWCFSIVGLIVGAIAGLIMLYRVATAKLDA